MSLLRACSGELTVKGNDLCRAQQRNKKEQCCILNKQYSICKFWKRYCDVLAWKQGCSLTQTVELIEHPGSGQHGHFKHKLFGSPQQESRNTLNKQRSTSSWLKYTNAQILADWPHSLTLSYAHRVVSQISLSPDRGERPLQNKAEVW